MKNTKFSITNLMLVLLISFSTYSCGTNSNREEKTTSVAVQSKPKPPSQDLIAAAFMGNLEAVKLHIAAGSDLNVKDPYGSTALLVAATFNKIEVAKALIEAGADLDIKNNDGSTALHTAAFLCRKEIVKALIDNGADKSIINNFGATALLSVSNTFEATRPIYEEFAKNLGPLGLKLDFDYLEKTRPVIAEMLK